MYNISVRDLPSAAALTYAFVVELAPAVARSGNKKLYQNAVFCFQFFNIYLHLNYFFFLNKIKKEKIILKIFFSKKVIHRYSKKNIALRSYTRDN